MEAIDNDNVDIDRVCNRITNGVLHHPAQRDAGEDGARDGRTLMFRSVEEWWNNMDRSQQDDYRRKLSRDGVERGENHKEGVQDTGHGHGCSGKMGMHKQFGGNSGEPETMEDKIASQAAGAIIGGLTGGISDFMSESTGGKVDLPTSDRPTQGGGLLGAATSLLSDAFSQDETDTYESRPHRNDDGGVSQTIDQYGRSSDGRRFEQAELTDTRYPDGRETQEFQRFEQHGDGRGHERAHGFEERSESYGSGLQRTEERRWEGRDDNFGERRDEDRHGGGGGHHQQRRDENEGGGGYGGGHGGGRRDEERRDEGGYGGRQEYGGGRQEQSGGRQEYGGGRQEEYGGRQEYGGGRQEEHGGRQEYGGGRQEYGGGRQEEYGGGRQEGGGGRREDEDNEYGEERRGGRREGGRRDDDNNEERRGGGGWFS